MKINFYMELFTAWSGIKKGEIIIELDSTCIAICNPVKLVTEHFKLSLQTWRRPLDALGNNSAISVIIMKMSMECSNQIEQKDPLSLKLEQSQKEVETTTSPWDTQERQLFLRKWSYTRVLTDNRKPVEKWDVNSQLDTSNSLCLLTLLLSWQTWQEHAICKTDNFFLNAQKSQSKVTFNLNPISKHSRAWVRWERSAEKEVPSSSWVDRGELLHLFSFVILQFLLLSRLDLNFIMKYLLGKKEQPTIP